MDRRLFLDFPQFFQETVALSLSPMFASPPGIRLDLLWKTSYAWLHPGPMNM
jgi:hypothetical protein